MVKTLISLKARETVAVITFNYDAGLDLALAWRGLSHDYCLEGSTEPEPVSNDPSEIPLLKLHGSVTWWRCGECGVINPVDTPGEFAVALNSARSTPLTAGKSKAITASVVFQPDQSIRFFPSRSSRTCSKCKKALEGEPFIVPPGWSKGDYRSPIEPVWRRAAMELSKAENIIVMGFSLLPSDGFFEQLLALGTWGEMPLRRFCVIDPSPDVAVRFKAKLGPGALERFSSPANPFDGLFQNGIRLVERMFMAGSLQLGSL